MTTHSIQRVRLAGLALSTLTLAAPGAAPAEPFAGYLPYPDALRLPYTDWELPHDAAMPMLASTTPYATPLPPMSSASASSDGHDGHTCPATATSASADARGVKQYPRAVLERPAIVPFGIGTGTVDLVAVPAGAGHAAHLAAAPAIAAGLPAGSDLVVAIEQPLGGDGGGSMLAVSTGVRLHGRPGLSVSSRSTVTYDLGASAWGTSTSGLRVAVTAGKLGVWIRPEQLRFDLDGVDAPRLTLPLAAGVQLTPTIWTQLEADVHVAELRDNRFVRAPTPALPVGVAAVISLAPRVDLRARVGGEVGADGVVSPTLSWLMGLSYIVGG